MRAPLLAIAFFTLLFSAKAQITWSPVIDVDTFLYGKNYPRIITDRAGDPLVLWNSASNVYLARWNGSGFTTPTTINPSGVNAAGGSWMGPDIAAMGDTVYIVYKEKPENTSGTPVWIVKSTDGGVTFSNPVQVDNIADSLSRFPTVTTDNNANPIVAFMEASPGFANHWWVVSKSTDMGQTFSADVTASGWSSSIGEVCDCCPGRITVSDNIVAMLYRDNNSNIRDGWVGISTDTGSTFTGGMAVNQQYWFINSCPSSGPDGFIIGDTIYSVEMNAGTGSEFVFFNKTSITAMSNSSGTTVVPSFPGLVYQNFPRIDHDGYRAAMVWKQYASNNTVIPLLYTDDVRRGFTTNYDTVAIGNLDQSDVAIVGNKIYVVWADKFDGNVKFRMGTISLPSAIEDEVLSTDLSIYPNPARNLVKIDLNKVTSGSTTIVLRNLLGDIVKSTSVTINENLNTVTLNITDLSSGCYFVEVSGKSFSHLAKLIVR